MEADAVEGSVIVSVCDAGVVTLLVLLTRNVKLLRLVGFTVIALVLAAHPEANTAAATAATLAQIFMIRLSADRGGNFRAGRRPAG